MTVGSGTGTSWPLKAVLPDVAVVAAAGDTVTGTGTIRFTETLVASVYASHSSSP